jgi:type II secretory pathway pseudopilin PulG
MKRRRGMTLVELMLAMFVATAVVGMLAAIVSRIMMANAAGRDHLQTVVALARLGEQFRRDVHEARGASVVPSDGPASRLKLDAGANRAIEYEITPAGLARRVLIADKVQKRDLFILPGMKCLDWKIEDGGRLVSLEIGRLDRPTSDAAVVATRFPLVAALANLDAAPQAAAPDGS